MKRKLFINLLFIVFISFLLTGKVSAATTVTKPPGYNFDEYIKILNSMDKSITKCKYFDKATSDVNASKTLCINKTLFEGPPYNIVYGTWADVEVNYTNKSVNYDSVSGQYRFSGLSPNGSRYQNISFPDDINRTAQYLKAGKFAQNPWDASKHPQLHYKAFKSVHKTYFPDPTNRVSDYKTWIFGGALDTQYPNLNEGRGYFLGKNDYHNYNWIVKNDSVYYGYGNNILHQYASVGAIPQGYSGGYFTLYRMASGCAFGYCYATFPILPQKGSFDEHDFKCFNNANINPNPRTLGGTATNIPIAINLYGSNTNRDYSATVTYGFKGESVTYKQNITMRLGTTLNLDLSKGISSVTGKTESVKFPAKTGNATFFYSIKSSEYPLEKVYDNIGNNDCTSTITIDANDNASVKLNPSTTKINAGQIFKGTFTVKNEFEKEQIDAPPVTTSGHARFDSSNSDSWVVKNNGKAVVQIYKGSTLLNTSSYNYSNIATDKTSTLTINSNYTLFDAGTDYSAKVCIPVYKSSISGVTESSADNCDTVKFEVKTTGDLSVDLSGKSTYESESDISLRYTLNNDYPKNHTSIPLTLKVINTDTNETVKTLTYDEKDVKIGDSAYGNFPSFQLPMGRYKATVNIPEFPGETDYNNNKDTFEFNVLPFTPDNIDCKILDLEQIKIVEGDKGVSKFCVGQTPNYPSTTTEEGQGTFFFVMYRILPMPIPAYEVTNLDDAGLYQLYTLKENYDERGDDNSFIFYPNNENNVKNLKGPYTAGPHTFYHYLYRGRMMPTEVTFTINVTDPNGKSIPQASGEVYYNIDANKCFNKNQLDIGGNSSDKGFNGTDPCRQIYFYLPKESTDNMTLKDLQNTPKADDRLYFKNPGVHTFQIKANEKQTYVYQKDNGAEWQGGEDADGNKYLRSPWKGESLGAAKGPVNTNTVENGEWKIQDTYKNHCYSDADAFNRLGQWIGTDFDANDNDRNICFHDHSADFHYWRFNWSSPSVYGDLDS